MERSRETPLAPSPHETQSRGRQALFGQRQPEWQCAEFLECYTRNFLSKDNCRASGKVKELQKVSDVNERCQIAPWPRQSGGGMTSGAAARPASTPEGPAQVLAQTRQQLAQAEGGGMTSGAAARPASTPEGPAQVLAQTRSSWHRLKEEAEMRQAQPMGQRMDQARARFRRAVHAGEKAQEAMLKAQANFEQAQQEVIKAQSDLHKLMEEAPLPVMPAPQVNMNLVKSLEALTGLIENMWNPEAGPPPDQLSHAIQESRATRVIRDLGPGGRCSFGIRGGRRAAPRSLGPG